MIQNRITPVNITKLNKNEIFVFGSNESGRHGKGAAKTALKWGAKYGQPQGIQGRTYAIPTKNKNITKTLTLPEIKQYVDIFIEFAKINKSLIFLVTEVGCGLGGLNPKDLAPLFKDVYDIENIYLPKKFWYNIS
jgi:hypothetical protein